MVDGSGVDAEASRGRGVKHAMDQANVAMPPDRSVLPIQPLAERVGGVGNALAETVTDAAAVTDSVLIARLRGGDTRAGESLVARHCEALLRYLRRLVGSEHLAEELHQQTWLSVLEHLDSFDLNGRAPAGSGVSSGFKPWLFRIATNKANDSWRSKGRERVAKAGLRLIVETESPEASHRMARNEQEHELQRAIDSLPESQRQVLLLRYYSDLKFVEIAEMLGCPLNTALGRMHKAMMKLKEALKN